MTVAAPTQKAEAPATIADVRAQTLGRKRERTRQRILDSAFALIGNERGLSVRIEEVCVSAGISRGTFYNYFASLDNMLEALAYELSHAFNVAVLETAGRMENCAERTNACMRYYLDRARNDPQWGWAMVNISAAGPLFGAETFASALATIEDGMARGEFDLSDARLGRDMVLGTCLAAMVTQMREPSPHTPSAMVSRHVLKGLGVPAATVEAIVTKPLPPLPLEPDAEVE